MSPSIPALPQPEWPRGIRDAIAALRPENPRHPILTTDGNRPKALHALGTFAHHLELMTAFHRFTGHLLYGSTLSLRHRELAILRVATVRDCEYEWLQHVVIGEDIGLSADEIHRTRTLEGWSPFETALLTAVDELIASAKVSDDTWAALAAQLDTRQLMDLVFTVGGYDALAMALLSFGVEVDDDLREYGRKRHSPE
jgi:alkylhydroperoxidase family enzyme